MKFAKGFKYSLLALVAVFAFTSDAAWARRGHHHRSHSRVRVGVGIGLGVPMFSPFYHSYRPAYAYPYYSPYYYSSYPYYGGYAPVVINRAPPVYIEKATIEAAAVEAVPVDTVAARPVVRAQAAAETYWYYCAASKNYYPYVDKCPSGWRKVPSRPAGVR
ncbi:MAG: hypothetical protein LBM17_06295 [Candidatus Accumulibacter sp.]|jgi:hypothetical protein|nr:hypothetical protein [Accumulibacter sp.]